MMEGSLHNVSPYLSLVNHWSILENIRLLFESYFEVFLNCNIKLNTLVKISLLPLDNGIYPI